MTQSEVDQWNAKYPVGTRCLLKNDDGTETATDTRSPAWKLPSGHVVVMIKGKSGGWNIQRLQMEQSPVMEGIPSIHDLAGQAYNVYCEAVGGVAFNGDPLPTWKEFCRDPKKEKQKLGWLRVGGLIHQKLCSAGEESK